MQYLHGSVRRDGAPDEPEKLEESDGNLFSRFLEALEGAEEPVE